MRPLHRARNFETRKNPLRAEFNVADVLRHRVGGAIGNTRRDSRGDLNVIRRALSDQPGLVPRASVKVLEVEAEIVQSVGDSLEHGVAGDLGQFLVEAGVENAKSDGIVLNRLMRLDDIAEILDIRGRRSCGRSARNFNLDDPATIEGVGKIGLRQGEVEVEGRKQRPRIKIADISAAAMQGLDDTKHGQSLKRFAETWPADAENLDKLTFGRQPVAGTQAPRSDQFENSSNHLLTDNSLVAWIHPDDSQISRFWPFRHCPLGFGTFAQAYSFCLRSPASKYFQTVLHAVEVAAVQLVMESAVQRKVFAYG
ncbi:MAG: hypothetical protein WCF81_01910 [Roseiarcus sp.]